MPVSIKDIAEHAQVSHAAVSVVLNDRQGSIRVSNATRDRILRIASELGYRKNALAIGLRDGKTQSIGVIWHFGDSITGDSVIGTELLRRLRGQGYATLHADHDTRIVSLLRELDDLASRQVDALVIRSYHRFLRTPEVVQRLERMPNVLVVCQETIPELSCDQLIHDRIPAIREVAEYLYKTGRRRAGMGVRMHEPDNHPKFHAFRERWLELGGEDHEHLLIDLGLPNQPRREAIPASLAPVFAQGDGIDAVFYINDLNAMFASHYLKKQLGKRIPEEVAVIGMNNDEAGEVWSPPLATISRQRSALVDAAEKMMLSRIATPDMPARQWSVPMQFLWRESAGPALPDQA